jgi:hypothetical protein
MDFAEYRTLQDRRQTSSSDKTGQVQSAQFANPFPDGATGYQTVEV